MNISLFLGVISILVDIILLILIITLYRKIQVLTPKKVDFLINELNEIKGLYGKLEDILKERVEVTKSISEKEPEKERRDSDTIKDKVLDLYKKGLEISEIATVTSLSQGEIELLLAISNSSKNKIEIN